jgi:uncharacterized UPF0160 family protein
MNNTKKIIAVHDGGFHTDDVCAVATLELFLNEEVEVIRTRDQAKIDSADFVVDVGGVYDPKKKRFDHHQGAGKRDNGIPYAAFGLVWKEYGKKLCDSEAIAEMIDHEMVQPVDANDNGVSISNSKIKHVVPYTFDDIIKVFNSTWEETGRDVYDVFLELVEFAKGIIAREIVRGRSREKAWKIVEKAYDSAEDKRLLIFDKRYPVRDAVLNFDEPLFFVMPKVDGNWVVDAIKISPESFELRKKLPREWAGERDKKLAEISGVEDAVFCHLNLFMAVAKSRAGAIALAKKALEY